MWVEQFLGVRSLSLGFALEVWERLALLIGLDSLFLRETASLHTDSRLAYSLGLRFPSCPRVGTFVVSGSSRSLQSGLHVLLFGLRFSSKIWRDRH